VTSTLPYKQIGVAVIWNDRSQILIDKRKPTGAMGGLWEFPGGKIEPGETVAECIVREIREELGIEIGVGEHLISIDHTYPNFSLTLIVHNCHHLSGIPQPIECDEVKWVNVSELDNYQFPEANIQIIETIKDSYLG
jgi:8-oxo-dGTP diphosphatase